MSVPSKQKKGGSGSQLKAGEPAEAELSFEESLARLEAVVDSLEDGELELETALTRFEEGVRLTRRCGEQLTDAERRIELLVAEGGELVARPFDNEGDSEKPLSEEES